MTSIQLPDRIVDLETQQVYGPEGSIDLTPNEGRLLARLSRDLGSVVSKADLLADVMGFREGVQTRALDAAIRRLRRKLESEQSRGQVLISVLGVGYRLYVEPRLPGELIGRGAEILAVERVLRAGIHVLVGPGGVGKTRLAMALRQRWTGPSMFVDLTRAVDGAGLVEGIARGLEIPVLSSALESQRDQIGAVLVSRPGVLVVLDNTEQVADEALALLESWADQAEQCVFLLTSRRSPGLGLTHEVQPLSLEHAVALYTRRASERIPDFQLDAAAKAHIVTFVKAVDALPLSIELAASRIKVLSPAELVARAGALSLRGSGSSHAATSAEECIAWSWQLLDPAERQGWIAAAVFEGGFTYESWEKVSQLARPLEVLESLLDHQLVRVSSFEEPRRYGMLNSLHQFARSRLEESPDHAEIERRHWSTFAGLSDEVCRRSESTGVHIWQETEYANLMVAFERALPVDARLATSCLSALEVIFEQRGPRSLRISMFTRCLAELGGSDDDLRSFVLSRLGLAYGMVGQIDRALELSEQAIALLDALPDPKDRALRLLGHGAVLLYAGQTDAASRTFAAGAVQAELAGDSFLLGLTHYNRAYGLILQGHTEQALEVAQLARVHLSAAGASLMVGAAYGLMGFIRIQDGGLEEARVALELASEQIVGLAGLICLDIQQTRAHLELAAGATREALAYFEEAIGEAEKIGLEDLHADLHSGYALTLADLGDWGRAEQAFAHARALYTRLNRVGKAGHERAMWGALTWIRGDHVVGLARLRAAFDDVEGQDSLFAVPVRSLLIIGLARHDPDEARSLLLVPTADVTPSGNVLAAWAEIAACALQSKGSEVALERATRLSGASPAIRLALRMLQAAEAAVSPPRLRR